MLKHNPHNLEIFIIRSVPVSVGDDRSATKASLLSSPGPVVTTVVSPGRRRSPVSSLIPRPAPAVPMMTPVMSRTTVHGITGDVPGRTAVLVRVATLWWSHPATGLGVGVLRQLRSLRVLKHENG